MIVFSVIVPHSPLLLPTIGKEHQKKLTKTLTAYKTLEEDLYVTKPDTLVVISPHGTTLPDAFPLFISPTYRADLKEFGDLTTTIAAKTDIRLIEKIRNLRLGDNPALITGLTDPALDYGAAVPLYFLTPHLPDIKVVSLGISQLPLSTHQATGEKIGEILQQSTKRIGVICSADLAHTLTDAAPGGFSPEGKKFDEALVQAVRQNDITAIMQLETKMELAKACGLRPIVMCLGSIAGVNYTPQLLSYEGPFGVGYLVAKFNFR